jgi:Na+-translocating ferredoxin:NAD+ oxidoreductase RnfG subunit
VFGLLLAAASLRAGGETPPEQRVRQAFPGAAIERGNVVLTEEQQARIEALCGERPDSPLVVVYRATRDGQPVGTAYFDVHRVRTLPQTLLVVLDATGRLERVEVLAFREPPEYRAPPRWLAQFAGRALDDELQLKRGLHGITGATLTARATTRSARRVLAIHRALNERAP